MSKHLTETRMKKTKFSIILLVSSNIITLCLLLFISFHFDVPTKVLNKLGITITEYNVRRSLFEVYQPKDIRIVMLGDSITYKVDWNELLSRTDVANRGIGNDNTKGFINRLSDIYVLNPETCFIMGGINDFIRGVSANKVFINYTKILKDLQNNGITPIIQSTLYVSETISNWSIINKKVDELNKMLREYANKEDVIFIDVNKELSTGGALDSIYTYDGVHLLGSGYVKWRDLILSTLTIKKNNIKDN
jgi:lysophospholipase L1-like esterase